MVRSSQSLSEEPTICTLLRGFGWISPHPRLWFATETPEYVSNCGKLEMCLRWFENQSSTLHSRAFALCDMIALLQNGHNYEVFGKVGQSSTSLGARIKPVVSSMLVGQG